MISPLNLFKACEDFYQFMIAHCKSHLFRHHNGHRSNNKDLCSKSTYMGRLAYLMLIFISSINLHCDRAHFLINPISSGLF